MAAKEILCKSSALWTPSDSQLFVEVPSASAFLFHGTELNSVVSDEIHLQKTRGKLDFPTIYPLSFS